MITKPLTASVIHCWTEDPAFDKSDAPAWDAKWKAFLDGSAKVDSLPTKDGQAPATFQLAPLTRKQFLRVADGRGDLASDSEVVAFSLLAVTGFDVGGQPPTMERVPTDAGTRLTDKSLDQIYDIGLFRHLAGRVLEISRIPK